MKLRIDPDRSRIRVEAKATLHAVTAEGPVTGSITLDPSDLAGSLSMEVSVELARVRSGDFLQDTKAHAHVEASRYPTARLVMERARGTPDALTIEGQIEWRGRRVPVRTTAHVTLGPDRASGEARFELDMREFGLVAPKLLFLKVSDVVRVEVRIVAGPGKVG